MRKTAKTLSQDSWAPGQDLTSRILSRSVNHDVRCAVIEVRKKLKLSCDGGYSDGKNANQAWRRLWGGGAGSGSGPVAGSCVHGDDLRVLAPRS
jgi:uncharacterized spore protein YtfJ